MEKKPKDMPGMPMVPHVPMQPMPAMMPEKGGKKK